MNAQASAIRLATAEDWPWMAGLLSDFYGDMIDVDGCAKYYQASLGRPDHRYYRGETSAVGACMRRPFWVPKTSRPMARDLFFCHGPERGSVFEMIAAMRLTIEWAKKMGCRDMHFEALNGADISGISVRAGAAHEVVGYRALF